VEQSQTEGDERMVDVIFEYSKLGSDTSQLKDECVKCWCTSETRMGHCTMASPRQHSFCNFMLSTAVKLRLLCWNYAMMFSYKKTQTDSTIGDLTQYRCMIGTYTDKFPLNGLRSADKCICEVKNTKMQTNLTYTRNCN